MWAYEQHVNIFSYIICKSLQMTLQSQMWRCSIYTSRHFVENMFPRSKLFQKILHDGSCRVTGEEEAQVSITKIMQCVENQLSEPTYSWFRSSFKFNRVWLSFTTPVCSDRFHYIIISIPGGTFQCYCTYSLSSIICILSLLQIEIHLYTGNNNVPLIFTVVQNLSHRVTTWLPVSTRDKQKIILWNYFKN